MMFGPMIHEHIRPGFPLSILAGTELRQMSSPSTAHWTLWAVVFAGNEPLPAWWWDLNLPLGTQTFENYRYVDMVCVKFCFFVVGRFTNHYRLVCHLSCKSSQHSSSLPVRSTGDGSWKGVVGGPIGVTLGWRDTWEFPVFGCVKVVNVQIAAS